MYNSLTVYDDKPTFSNALKRFFRNKYWLASFAIVGIAGLLFSLFPEAFADYTNVQGVKDNFENFINGAQKTSVQFMGEAYKLFGEIFRPSYVTEQTANSLTGGKSAISFLPEIQAVIVTLAGGAIAVFFTTNIIKEAQKGSELSNEYWQRVILNLVISLVATLLATRLMLAIYLMGSAVIDIFTNAIKDNPLSGLDKDQFAQYLSKIPGMESLPDIVGSNGKNAVDYEKLKKANSVLVMMEYIVWFPMVISVFLMYSAIFEIKVRELFAPVAVSSIMIEGSRGSGARFLKKFAACYLKIAIYFIIAYFGMALTQYFFSKLGSSTGEAEGINLAFICMLMSNVVAGMAMMQTGGLADEILGV